MMQRQNDIFERVVDATPNALYVDTWDRFATRDGDYTPFYWSDGKVELVRAPTGCTSPRAATSCSPRPSADAASRSSACANALDD